MKKLSISELSEFQGRTYILAKAYEEQRRKHGQGGFRIFWDPDQIDPSSPHWKSFTTVLTWLEKTGWVVTWKTVHWQGYVAFAFEESLPTILMPGQLKNIVLLKKYLTSAPKVDFKPERTPHDMEAIYSKVVRSEISSNTLFMQSLGIKRLSDG